MAHIQELSAHLADLIAAGEVVERPASVAKELLENAIDAGATRVDVEIKDGGISYLRISDNGCGIAAEEAPIAFRRHATSKLRTEDDLASIGTLGFRGEALAAIAAVSRIDLFTKQQDTIAGTHLHLEAGTVVEHEEAGCPDGTTFIVRDLFFNTPARMKFLKKDFTEAGYVLSVVQHAALSHPEIAFSLTRDGKQVFASAGDTQLLTPVFGVFGKDITQGMLSVATLERDGMFAWGYVTKPYLGRPNRSMQHFFVNGRYVKNRIMQAALEEAYRNKIISGKYPSCALFLSLPFGLVDVNVHPAKTEIKFASEKQVFEIIYIACKNTLEQDENIPEVQRKEKPIREDNVTSEQESLVVQENLPRIKVSETPMPKRAVQPVVKDRVPNWSYRQPIVECEDDFDEVAPVLQQPKLQVEVTMEAPKPTADTQAWEEHRAPIEHKTVDAIERQCHVIEARAAAIEKPIPRVMGEAFHTYIIAEEADGGLLLIDKHAAHERMIFNQLRENVDIPQQELLSPLVVELSALEYSTLTQHLNEMQTAGFDMAPFGTGSFAVRSAPAHLDSADIPSVLSEMADKLASNRAAVSDTLDDLIHMVACKAAIKAGKHSDVTELQSLCERVVQDPDVTCCPHGRPVAVRLTRYELDKLFKRVNQ